MKKLLLSFLALNLTLLSCTNEKTESKKYKKFHVKSPGYSASSKNNFGNVERIKKRSRVLKPSEIAALGEDKNIELNNLSSIKSSNNSAIIQNSLLPISDVYNDFAEICPNGKYVGQYKIGNSYEIDGVPYYPQEYEDYEEVGVASWYGEDFHGRKTANGEIYNLDSMTAAHQTLPLPSVVKVTNLDNGKAALVRVNDRGPFAKSRVIDLSKKAADVLGYRNKGTANVRVEFMADETQKLLKSLNIK